MRRCVGFTALLLVHSAWAEGPPSVGALQKQVSSINRHLKRCTKQSIELEGFSTMGGTAELYFEGTELRKVVLEHLGESGKGNEELVFDKGSLLYHETRDHEYNFPVNDYESIKKKKLRVVRTTKAQLYFHGGQLVHFLKNGRVIARSTKFFQDEGADKRKDASRWLSVAKRCGGKVCKRCTSDPEEHRSIVCE